MSHPPLTQALGAASLRPEVFMLQPTTLRLFQFAYAMAEFRVVELLCTFFLGSLQHSALCYQPEGWEDAGRFVSSLLTHFDHPIFPNKNIQFKTEKKHELRMKYLKEECITSFCTTITSACTFKHVCMALDFTQLPSLPTAYRW